MFKHKSTKTAIVLAVAVLMVAAVMLTACTHNPFKPVTPPEGTALESNGGSAVKYGEYLYYVNGYQSASSAENTYEEAIGRVGAIARIKLEDLEALFAVYDDSKITSSTARTEKIAEMLAEKAQIVVPKFYYSGNTTTTQLNGIYIFDERIYILTPNDELTAGGNTQTEQNVLTSFKLDGSDEQRHYTFTTNSAQIMLDKVSDKLVATYIMGSTIGCVDVAKGTDIAKIEDTSSAQFDVAGKAIAYLDKDGAICKLNAGADKSVTLVENNKDESTVTYTIASTNMGYVYYTKADSINSSIDNTCIYYVTEATASKAESERVALATTAPSSNYYGYKETIVHVTSTGVYDDTLYGIYVLDDNKGEHKTEIVSPEHNSKSITFNRLEGNMLYYTSDSVAYVVDLSAETPAPKAIGRSLASASGWAVPDMVGEYVITLSSGSVKIVKFDADKKENSSEVTLTLVAPKTDEETK